LRWHILYTYHPGIAFFPSGTNMDTFYELERNLAIKLIIFLFLNPDK